MGQRRDAICALSRIAPDVTPAHQDDLEAVAAFLSVSMEDLRRAASSYTTVETKNRLKVSLPTVHAWIKGGLLPVLPARDKAETLVDRGFVDKLAEALDAVRATGTPKHLLRDVAALLESKEFSEQNPDLAHRLRAGKRGARVPWRQALTEAWGSDAGHR